MENAYGKHCDLPYGQQPFSVFSGQYSAWHVQIFIYTFSCLRRRKYWILLLLLSNLCLVVLAAAVQYFLDILFSSNYETEIGIRGISGTGTCHKRHTDFGFALSGRCKFVVARNADHRAAGYDLCLCSNKKIHKSTVKFRSKRLFLLYIFTCIEKNDMIQLQKHNRTIRVCKLPILSFISRSIFTLEEKSWII